MRIRLEPEAPKADRSPGWSVAQERGELIGRAAISASVLLLVS